MARWIKIHSSLLEWKWWGDANMVKAWIYLLMKAEWQDREEDGEVISRGTLVTTRKQLMADLKLTEQQVRTVFRKLTSTGEITIKLTNKYSIVTVCNYDTYQIEISESNQQNNRQPNTISKEKESNKETRKEKQKLKDDSSDEESQKVLKPCDFVAIWNAGCPSKKASPRLLEYRRRQLKARVEEITEMGYDPGDVIRTCAEKVEASDFASGRNGQWKHCGFLWLIEHPEHWLKVYQGFYDNKTADQPRCPSVASVAEQLYQAREEAKQILKNYTK